MKRILFTIATVVMTLIVSTLKTSVPQKPLQAQQSAPTASVAKSEPITQPAPEKPPEPPSVPPRAQTCREAIAKTWPSNLQAGAIIVLEHENRSENPKAAGAVNKDGTQDFGCFQINNHWHANFFATNDWTDPESNAAYAYQIYLGRANTGRNGWSSWYAVQGILW